VAHIARRLIIEGIVKDMATGEEQVAQADCLGTARLPHAPVERIRIALGEGEFTS